MPTQLADRIPDGARKELVLFTYRFPPDNTSGADRPLRFAKYLPCYGFTPHVIAAANGGSIRDGGNVHRVAADSRHSSGRSRADRLSEVAACVQRFILPYDERLPWVPHALAEADRMFAAGNISAVISTSPPLAPHLAAMRMKRRHGVRWIADFRDPLYGNPDRSRWFATPYDAAIERLIFRHADAIIANTDAVASVWTARYPRWRHKISVIWNGFDPEDTLSPAPIPARPFKVLVHAGTIYMGRHPGALLASIDRLIRGGLLDPASLRVRLVGTIAPASMSLTQPPASRLMELGCLECNNRHLPRDEARRAVSEADFLLLLDLADRNTGMQVPAKVFDYIRVGRPILAFTSKGSPTERILEQSGIPFQCIYVDMPEREIDVRILNFLCLPNVSVRASSWFWNQFDGAKQARVLAQLLAG